MTETSGETTSTKPTLVFVVTKKVVTEFDRKMTDILLRWHRLGYGGRLMIERPSGKKISYEGILFAGSPREVYWGTWSEDFFQDEIPKILSGTADIAVQAGEDVARSLDEAVSLLFTVIVKFYREMEKVDQRLMGDGVRLGVRREASVKIKSVKEYARAVSDLMKRTHTPQDQHHQDSADNKDLFEFKPGFLGFKIDLIELYRRIRRRIRDKG